MPRPKSTPGYCLHRRSGRAYTTIDGRQIPLGIHDTPESRAAYDKLIATWLLNGRTLPAPDPNGVIPGPTVSVIIQVFWNHAQTYYRHADGTPTSEVEVYRYALRLLRRLYGATQAAAFGPRDLKALREVMIRPGEWVDPETGRVVKSGGWCRRYANKQIYRIKSVFKWAAENEFVPAAVYNALAVVANLKAGRCDARETAPVRAVAAEMVEQVLPHLPATVRKMVELEFLSGARGGELFPLRACDIDTGGKTWVYRPAHHKTAHHNHAREIHFGPKAIKIIRSLLKPNPQAYLFSPRDAEAERNASKRRGRKSPMTPSHAARFEAAGRRRRKRPPGEKYDKDSYGRAVTRACEKAFPVPEKLKAGRNATPEQRVAAIAAIRAWKKAHRFAPHQLRHATATRLRKLFGLEAAGVVLGHKTMAATLIYAEHDQELAAKVMRKIG